MNEDRVKKILTAIAKKTTNILSSDDPKQAVIDHFAKMGIVNADGTLHKNYGGD